MEKTAKKPTAAKQIQIKLIHSAICTTPKQRKTLRALGLTKINQVKTMPDNDCSTPCTGERIGGLLWNYTLYLLRLTQNTAFAE